MPNSSVLISRETVSPSRDKQFRERGYFLLEKCFSREEMDELKTYIEPFVEAKEKDLEAKGLKNQGISRANQISFTEHLAEKSPEIMNFVKHEVFQDLCLKLIGPEVSLYWDQAVYKRPENPKDFPWHQDNGYTPIEPENYLTCWIALEDATIENGCIWVMPETHKQGTVEHRDTPIGKQCYFGNDKGVPVPLRQGGMAVFSSLTFHKSGPNLTRDKIRKGYIVQFCHAQAVHQITRQPLNRTVVFRQRKTEAG